MLKWIALVSTALGDYQLMCHTPVALDVTAVAFVPDTYTEGVQVSTGTLNLS